MSDKLNLLLVDDEQNITRSIKRACRQRNYNVFIANSGAEALEILKKEGINVILSDQMMPGMTGSELFEKVAVNYPQVVRILLTGHTALEGITKAVNKGAVFKIMFKPWEDEELLNTIDEAFNFYNINEKNKQLAQELQVLNKELEAKVEEKTRYLQLHVEQLKLAHKLFDYVPDVAIGLSDELLIVDANRAAVKLFMPQPLVGRNAQDVFPESLTLFIESLREENCEAAILEKQQQLTMNDLSYNFFCRIVQLSETQKAILLFGSRVL